MFHSLPTPPNVDAVLLLLGGHSTRMGTPKHLLIHPVSGLPLYRHALQVLKEVGDFEGGIWIGCREDQKEGMGELPEDVGLIIDDPTTTGSIGPATGILRAHALHPTLTFLILAIDLPFLTSTSITHLLTSFSTASPPAPVMLYLHPSDSNPEPLFSIWTPPALDQLERNVKRGKSGPCRAAKDVLGGRVHDGPGGGGLRVREGWEEVVRDADTVEEWEEAVRLLKGGQPRKLAQTGELGGDGASAQTTNPTTPRAWNPTFLDEDHLTQVNDALPTPPCSVKLVRTSSPSIRSSTSSSALHLEVTPSIASQDLASVREVPFVVPGRKTVSFEQAMELVQGVVEEVKRRREAGETYRGLQAEENIPSDVLPEGRIRDGSASAVDGSNGATRLMPVVDAVGYRVAADYAAKYPFPLFDNSAMDGYLVRSSFLASASTTEPVELRVIGRILAGDVVASMGGGSGLDANAHATSDVVESDTMTCFEIMTGGEFPSEEEEGMVSPWDAVVKVEDTSTRTDEVGDVWVNFGKPERPGSNRRKAGEEIRPGHRVLMSGEMVTPEKVMLSVASGIQEIRVKLKPVELTWPALEPGSRGQRRVAIIATGNEVVPLESLDGPPRRGQVIDCVTPFLRSLLAAHGCETTEYPPAGDDPLVLAALLETALATQPRFDLILTVAGVSIGTADNLASVLAGLGTREIFHGVKIKPGRPVMLSTSRDGTPILSLPGNPLAAVVNMRSFGLTLLGIEAWEPMPERDIEIWQARVGRLPEEVYGFYVAMPGDDRGLTHMPGSSGLCRFRDLILGTAWVRGNVTQISACVHASKP